VRRVQGTVVDDDDTETGNGNVFVYLNPDPNVTPFSYVSYAAGPTATPFDIAIAADGSAWMTNSNPPSSGIVHLHLRTRQNHPSTSHDAYDRRQHRRRRQRLDLQQLETPISTRHGRQSGGDGS